jgi:hypothetical protein
MEAFEKTTDEIRRPKIMCIDTKSGFEQHWIKWQDKPSRATCVCCHGRSTLLWLAIQGLDGTCTEHLGLCSFDEGRLLELLKPPIRTKSQTRFQTGERPCVQYIGRMCAMTRQPWRAQSARFRHWEHAKLCAFAHPHFKKINLSRGDRLTFDRKRMTDFQDFDELLEFSEIVEDSENIVLEPRVKGNVKFVHSFLELELFQLH